MDYVSDAIQQAYAYGVPPSLFVDLIGAESGFNPTAANPRSSAFGLSQVLRGTAADPGYGVSPVNPADPKDSLRFAAQYLRAMYDRVGNWGDALLAYSKGLTYAQANPGTTAYPGNGPLLSDVRDLAGNGDGSAGNSAGGGGASNNNAAGNSGGSGCGSWVTTPGACFNDAIGRAGYVVLGLIVIAVGLWMLSK